ncbi:MAG: hypothetical protein JJU46_08535 [Balneolaceae bacterium]|nr:hypothetical protein [Balneolaceae bacterium]MCH8547224.1 hypothetical protein [Balneolaceae bacterium]
MWRIQESGTYVEFSVDPAHTKMRESYRSSVLHIGRALQALQNSAQREGIPHHIQSFPNLENSSIIAVLRLSEHIRKSRSDQYQNGSDQPVSGTPLETMERVATNLQLKVQKTGPDSPLVKKSEVFQSGQHENLVVLQSKTDNPFTWLNTGYWMEIVGEKLKGEYIIPHIDQLSDIDLRKPKESDGGYYSQLLVQLPKTEKRTAV